MSRHNARCTRGAEIENPGAFARHAQACDVCEQAREAEENAENGGFRASDMLTSEIPVAVERADADTLDATLAKHGHEPAPEDTRETAVAKALILAKSGGKEAYAEVFGTCGVPECEYGANGFRATTCKRHADEQATRESAEVRDPEPAETPESVDSAAEIPKSDELTDAVEREPTDTDALPSEGKIAGRLVSEGMDPELAAQAGEYVRDAISEGADPSDAVAAFEAIHG